MSEPELIGNILKRVFLKLRDEAAAESGEDFNPDLSGKVDYLQTILDSLTGGLIREDLSGDALTIPGPAPLSGGTKDERDNSRSL